VLLDSGRTVEALLVEMELDGADVGRDGADAGVDPALVGLQKLGVVQASGRLGKDDGKRLVVRLLAKRRLKMSIGALPDYRESP
jgi:hypothetical protein